MRLPFKLQYVNFFFIVSLGILKIIVQGILAKESGNYSSFICSFVAFFGISFIAFLYFYCAYRGFFYDEDVKIIYRISVFLIMIYMFCNCVLYTGFFDGLGKIISRTDDKEDFIGFLLILEFIMTLFVFVNCIVGIVTYLRIKKRFDLN